MNAAAKAGLPCPCNGCPQQRRCAREALACERYFWFVQGKSWQSAPRAPTRMHYIAAMT